MSGSVTDSDVCGTDWEKWIPQIDSTYDKYNFTWKPPWKNFRIKICSNNKNLNNTSGFLIPLKMQFLITHHLSTVQKIIRNLECSIVESINSAEELLEIKVKSLESEDIFTEIERALARETDDIVMKPIQRLEFTSSLVEELFKKELKEQCIDLMRDETNIFVVGFEHMKSLITKNIDEINRVTATKVVKLGDKWKIEAVKCFGITETLSKTFSDVVVRLQEETFSVYLKGRDVAINKAEKEVHKLLSDLFNEKLLFDPLTLKLLIFKETSEVFNEILQKEHLQVVWTVDSTHLYFFSKTKIDTNALKAIVYENFLTAGFSQSPQHGNQFCNSNAFIEITKKHNNKLLFLETTKSSVNIAGTKNLIFYLLHQEKLFYNDVGNAKEIQVDTLSFEVATIKDEKIKIDREKRELEVKLNDETQKRKNANDQYQLLERKCNEGEEKLKRITLEKELLLRESRDKEANFITQLEELKKLNDKQQKTKSRASSDTKRRAMPGPILQHRPSQIPGYLQLDLLNPRVFAKQDTVTEEVSLKHFQLLVLLYLHFLDEMQNEFKGLCVLINMKKHVIIIRGTPSHIIAAKVKMYNKLGEIISANAGEFSDGYIEFLKIPEVKTYVGQQMKQKGVLGVWNVQERNIIMMYSLSDEGAVTACDLLHKSVIENRINLDVRQCYLIGTDIWNEEIKTVQMEYQKALVKIVVADTKTVVIYQTSAEDEGIVKEKVTDIFYRHAISEENIQLPRSELRLLQEQYQTDISTLKKQFAKDHVILNIDNVRVFIQGNSNGVKNAKQKIDDILRSIYRKKYTMKKAGIVKHMTGEQGQAKISQVEKRNKVVVQLQTDIDSDDEDDRRSSQPISPMIKYTETAVCTIFTGQTITTVVGDITELDVDVIVNAANKELQHVAGLAKIIVDKGGNSIQKECDDYLRSKSRARKLYEGEIFCSSPGNLNCKMIAHAVGPVWQNGRSSEDEYLSECIQASLEKTEDKKYRSIAIPALCTGVFGYPPNKATKVILEAIRDYLRENGATSPVRQIYLCDVKEDIVDHFVSALERYFDKANIKKQVGNPGFVRRPPLRFLPDQGVSGGWQQRALADNRQGSVDIGNLTLKVYQGDLTEASVEVIVNGTNRELDLTRGGVSQAILKKGGRELSQLLSVPAAKKEMKREGVATTTAGSNFSCDFIIHINMEDSHMDLKAKFETVLEKVDELNKTSVALPALGAGISYSIDKVAENLFEALVSFHRKTTDISEVHVVIYEKDKLSQFLAAMQNCLQSQSYQSQGLISKVKGIFGYGEKKSVSTKQWKVSKMPSSVLNLVVYAKKQIDADSALRSLEESLINDYKEKLIEDTVIKELTKEQEAKILKLEETCEVEIEFNKRIGRIKFRGLIENLSEAMDEVHKNLRDVERQRQKQQHAKLVADMVQWYFISVEDTGQKLEEYPAEVNLILEQALKNNESQAIYFDKSGNRYIVDFNNYEAFPEDDPFDYVAVLRKSKMTDYAFEMPPNWASMDQNENIKIVTLQLADKEYQDVVQDFQMNMAGNYKSIIKMEKIQNKTLQQQYEAKKLSMHSTNATGTNYERKLWHGTTMEAVDSINTFGFNRSYCGKNAVAYGNGVYFAVNPTYSAQAHYARPYPHGNKRMYMCKVLVGDFAKGHGGMKVPPPKPGAAGGHILYDSVVDNPQNPGIFVIFHDSQAYPEYLIVFK